MTQPRQNGKRPIRLRASNSHHRRTERKRVSRACDYCKVKKRKCDGSHPCEPCRSNGGVCSYETKRSRDAKHQLLRMRQLLDQGVQLLYKACADKHLFPGAQPKEVDGKVSTLAILEGLGIMTASVEDLEFENRSFLPAAMRHALGSSVSDGGSLTRVTSLFAESEQSGSDVDADEDEDEDGDKDEDKVNYASSSITQSPESIEEHSNPGRLAQVPTPPMSAGSYKRIKTHRQKRRSQPVHSSNQSAKSSPASQVVGDTGHHIHTCSSFAEACPGQVSAIAPMETTLRPMSPQQVLHKYATKAAPPSSNAIRPSPRNIEAATSAKKSALAPQARRESTRMSETLTPSFSYPGPTTPTFPFPDSISSQPSLCPPHPLLLNRTPLPVTSQWENYFDFQKDRYHPLHDDINFGLQHSMHQSIHPAVTYASLWDPLQGQFDFSNTTISQQRPIT